MTGSERQWTHKVFILWYAQSNVQRVSSVPVVHQLFLLQSIARVSEFRTCDFSVYT